MTNKRLNKVEDNTILFLDEDKLRIDQFIALQKANERNQRRRKVLVETIKEPFFS